MERPRITGMGEALWDMLPEGKKIGGAPANFAYHMSQFGYDATAVSAVGRDAAGDELLDTLAAKGLACIMPRIDKPTGTVAVRLDAAGIPEYDITENAAWDFIPFTDRMRTLAQQCRCICFGSLAQRNAVSRDTIRTFVGAMPEGALKVFDINLRQHYFDRETVVSSLDICDILKINDEETQTVARLLDLGTDDMESVCLQLKERHSLRAVILTCGVAGSRVYHTGGVSSLPTPRVKVADTVGAGDSFTAGFCAAMLAGLPVERAHAVAVETSAYVCSQHGAMPQLPPDITGMINR